MTQLIARDTEHATYRRDSAFSYVCHACNRCCHDKIIKVNPYEAARLARNRGLSTTEFLLRYVESNATTLRRVEHGACIFLTAQGCSVHADRPLVCRLYPLGRRVSATGAETFREVAAHPESDGEYGTNGSVADYLTRQEVQPFIDAVDAYVTLVGRMVTRLREETRADPSLQNDIRDELNRAWKGDDAERPAWLDMDHAVERYCTQAAMSVPADLEARLRIHLDAIEAWLEQQT